MILNQTPLNFVPLDSSSGVVAINPAPGVSTTSTTYSSYVLTSLTITPTSPSTTSSAAGLAKMALEVGPPATTIGLVVEQTSPSLHLGIDFSAPSVTHLIVAPQAPSSYVLGLDFPATSPALVPIVPPTGSLIISFEYLGSESVAELVYSQPGLTHFGQEILVPSATTSLVLQTSPFISVSTSYLDLTGSGSATTSCSYQEISLSSISTQPNPGISSSSSSVTSVVLGSIQLDNLKGNTYSTSLVENVVLSSITVSPSLPTISSIVGNFSGATIISAPPPLVVVPDGLPIVESFINDGAFNITLSSISIPFYNDSPGTASSIAVSDINVIGSAVITPSPAEAYSMALLGSIGVPVTVSPSASVTSSCTGEFQIAPLVISGLSASSVTSSAVSLNVLGSVSITPVVPEITTKIFPPEILTTSATVTPSAADVTSSATCQVVMSTVEIRQVSTNVISSANNPQVVFGSISVTPNPGEVHSSISITAVEQPDIVIDGLFAESTSSNIGNFILSSITFSPFAQSYSSALSQFKFGVGGTSIGYGGVVVETDDRNVLNVDPLNKPGLNSINVQN